MFDLAAETGNLAAPEVREHLRHCPSCSFELREQERIDGLLRELGRAETSRDSVARSPWAGLVARLDTPRRRDRLPLPVAGLLRLLGSFAQPPVVAAWATGIAGIVLGLWLGSASQGTSLPPAYEETSLIEDSQAGWMDALGTNDGDETNTDDSTGSQ